MTDTPFNGGPDLNPTRNTPDELTRARLAVASIAARQSEPAQSAAVVLQALGLIPYSQEAL